MANPNPPGSISHSISLFKSSNILIGTVLLSNLDGVPGVPPRSGVAGDRNPNADDFRFNRFGVNILNIPNLLNFGHERSLKFLAQKLTFDVKLFSVLFRSKC